MRSEKYFKKYCQLLHKVFVTPFLTFNVQEPIWDFVITNAR